MHGLFGEIEIAWLGASVEDAAALMVDSYEG